MKPALPAYPPGRLPAPRFALALMLIAGGLASPSAARPAQPRLPAASRVEQTAPPPGAPQAPSTAFTSPIVLYNTYSNGSNWTVTPTGGTTDGTPTGTVTGTVPGLAVYDATYSPASSPRTDAFDYGLTLWVNNQIYAPTTVVSYTDLLLFDNQSLSGLTVSESFRMVSNEEATLSALVGLTNPSGSPVSAPVYWASNLGSDATTRIYDTSAGAGNVFGTDDRWIITDDGVANHDPVVTHVLGGPGTPLVTASSVTTDVHRYASNTNGVGATFSVTVPANATRYLLFFAQLALTDTVAASRVTAFNTNPAATSHLVSGIAHSVLLKTVNWAFTNATPVANDDNLVAFTDGGAQPLFVVANDSDVDNDSLYLTAITQPAHGAASIGHDQYGDRFIVYTPTAGYAGPDLLNYTISDGLGGSASAPVNISVGGPTAVSLPWTLMAGPGPSSRWDMANDSGTDNGLPQGGSCAPNGGLNAENGWVTNYPFGFGYFAYNPGALVWVGGQIITSTSQVTASAHSLETAPMITAGLRASLRYSGLPGSNTLRTLASFYNPLGGTINTTITFVSNLYPGGSTAVRATSNGNNIFEAADRWVVMSDNAVKPYYAATGHVLYGPGPVAVPASSVSQTVFECSGSTTGVLARYSLSVPPGATRRLMFFNQMALTNEAAEQAVTEFDGPLTPEVLFGISSSERTEIMNWVMPRETFLPTLQR